MKKWLKPLIGFTLGLATIGAVTAFATAGDGSGSPAQDNTDVLGSLPVCEESTPDCNDTLAIDQDDEGGSEPSGDQPPVRIDDDMDPTECSRVHNITACEGQVPGSDGASTTLDQGETVQSDPPCCKVAPNPSYDGDDQNIAVGEPYPDKGDTTSEPEPYPMPVPGIPVDPLPVSDVVCSSDQAVSITSEGQVSCLDMEPAKDDNDAESSPEIPPAIEPVMEPAR